MEHPKEEELIAFHDGDRSDREKLSAHLESCAECRASLEKIEAVFAAMMPCPFPTPAKIMASASGPPSLRDFPKVFADWTDRIAKGEVPPASEELGLWLAAPVLAILTNDCLRSIRRGPPLAPHSGESGQRRNC